MLYSERTRLSCFLIAIFGCGLNCNPIKIISKTTQSNFSPSPEKMSFLALSVLIVLGSAKNCTTSLSELETRLYDGLYNQEELHRAFFPQHERTSRFIRVNYVFEGSALESECTVSYFWAIGGFLLIQPPSVFRFTSLYFSYPANSIDSITLRLPEECLPLVYNEMAQNCSCAKKGNTLLDILTHHVSLVQYYGTQ